MRTTAARAMLAALTLAATTGCGIATSTPASSESRATAEASENPLTHETPDVASPSGNVDLYGEGAVVTFEGSVPDGWTDDGPGSVPVPDSDTDTDTRFFEIHLNPSLMAADCGLDPEPGVGTEASTILAEIADRDGIHVSDRGSTTVDGRAAEWIDFVADEVTCPRDATEGFVPMFGWFDEDDLWQFTGAAPGETHRLIAVDLERSNLLIWTYALEPDALEDQLEAAMDVVAGLRITEA